MYTLTALITQCRNLVGDTSVSPYFSDAMMTDFINRAMDDLSLHFPRQVAVSLSTTAGEHEYALPMDTLQVLGVEYPVGEMPRRYLELRSFTEDDFWNSERYYDVIQPQDSDSDNPPMVMLSIEPAGIVGFRVYTATEHRRLSAGADECTVPDRLINLVGLFVRWKCWQQMSSDEAMDPDPLHLLAATQENNAGRAEAAYRRALEDALTAQTASRRSRWRMDRHDRVY